MHIVRVSSYDKRTKKLVDDRRHRVRSHNGHTLTPSDGTRFCGHTDDYAVIVDAVDGLVTWANKAARLIRDVSLFERAEVRLIAQDLQRERFDTSDAVNHCCKVSKSP